MKRGVLSVVFLMSLCLLAWAEDAGKQIGLQNGSLAAQQMYPDVWGIELPLPQENIRWASPSALYEDENGDLIVQYSIFFDDKHLVRLVSFFTGEVKAEYFYISEEIKKKNELISNYLNNLKKLDSKSILPDVLLPDGGRLKKDYVQNWVHPSTAWFAKYDPDGKELFRRVILCTSEKPFVIRRAYESSMMDGSGTSTEALVHTSAFYLTSIWMLKDGTYIVADMDKSILIRFRQDFSTPYIATNDKLLMFNAEPFIKKIEEFFWESLKLKPMEVRKLPSGEKLWIWPVEGCRIRLECMDRKITSYFYKQTK